MNTLQNQIKAPGVALWLPILLLLPMVAWTLSIFSTSVFTPSSVQPAGQSFYVASKAFGLVAISITGLQILIGYSKTPLFRRAHIVLGVTLLFSALAHWFLFSYAVGQRTGSFPLKNLIPLTDGKYYHTGIMFGALALWSLLVVSISGIGRFKRYALAKTFHRFGSVVFLFAVIHALMIGTEANSAVGKAYLLSMTVLVCLAFFCRYKQRFNSEW